MMVLALYSGVGSVYDSENFILLFGLLVWQSQLMVRALNDSDDCLSCVVIVKFLSCFGRTFCSGWCLV